MIYQESNNIEELIGQYKQTLRDTNDKIESLKREIDPYKEIYEDERKSKKKREHAKATVSDSLHELGIYRSIKSSLEYSLRWMEKGHSPENRRGIERLAAYQIEKPIDPLLMQRYFRSHQPEFPWETDTKENVITRSEKELLDKATKTLTKKELEVLLLFKGKSFSQYKIAEMLDISRNSVKTMIRRANKKINAILSEDQGDE